MQVTDPRAYAEAFGRGDQVEIPLTSKMRGRILRGRQPSDFQQLGPPDGRRLVFIMGPDGLEALPGRDLRQSLGDIGLQLDYVQGRIDQGFSFKLLVFEGGDEAPLATWDNALTMIAWAYPEYPELSADIEQHRETFKRTPFSEFQARVPVDFDVIDLAGESHPLFMTLDRYFGIPGELRQTDPLYLRSLLLHQEHLGPLFAGDGYTRTPGGEIGPAEYLVLNRPVADLQSPYVIDLLTPESAL